MPLKLSRDAPCGHPTSGSEIARIMTDNLASLMPIYLLLNDLAARSLDAHKGHSYWMGYLCLYKYEFARVDLLDAYDLAARSLDAHKGHPYYRTNDIKSC